MMLKTSSRKINPFWNMVGFTLRKNLGIIIVLCIAALVYCPGSFIINLEHFIVRAQNNYNSYIASEFATIVTVVSAIAVVFFNMLNFSFLYKKNSSDVFHSFPLTRSELLLSRFISGLASTLIPTLICYISFSIITAIYPWVTSFAQIAYYLLHTVIIIFVCSSFSLVFVVCAGSMFDLGVSLIGANLALLAVGWIFEAIFSEVLLGFSGDRISETLYNLSPPYFCGTGLGLAGDIEKGISGQSINFLIRSIIYIAAFTIISVLLYNRRKAEKGGTGYAYKFMFFFCSLLAGVCGGYLFGMMFNANITSLAFWFFAIIGALLTTVVYGTITNRGFKGVGQSLLMGGVSAIILIAVTVIGATGGLGYAKRIPDANKIENVTINAFGEEIIFDNPKKVLDLHKQILDTNSTEFTTSYAYTQTVSINYKLKNGTVMSRNYTMESSKVGNELLSIYKSDERLDMMNEIIDITDAERLYLYFHIDEEYYNVEIAETEAQEFMKAYWQDVTDSTTSVFDKHSYEYIEISGDKMIDTFRNNYFHFQFEFFDSFENTKQFIEKHNLVARANK